MRVDRLSADQLVEVIPRLADILIDAVASGAGVSFLHPLSNEKAQKFWHDQVESVKAARSFVFVCRNHLEQIMGVVMLHRAWALNQPARADVAKLLVHQDFRRQGVGSALMLHMEQAAKKLGLKMINFDAVAGGAPDRLYRALGYHVVGIVPQYALNAKGDQYEDVVFFYKTF